jgi:SAM-dependent methyltransferase
MQNCRICGSTELKVYYKGPIRKGKFGGQLIEIVELSQCNQCKTVALPESLVLPADFYESETYRLSLGEGADIESFWRLHDPEQSKRLAFTGTGIIRNKVVCDVGCGGGSFLNLVQGLARSIIAIEPCRVFHRALKQNGFQVYPYVSDAVENHRGTVDVAVSFATLEHVNNPLAFLQDIRALLRPGGVLILSTPNLEDILLEALPDVYPGFFFRAQHLWYFSGKSLQNILELAGFTRIKVVGYQRFGIGNFLSWLLDKGPKGNVKFDYVTPAVDQVWKTELERTFRSDFLYATCSCQD